MAFRFAGFAEDLRGLMDFQGFVMSDWLATHTPDQRLHVPTDHFHPFSKEQVASVGHATTAHGKLLIFCILQFSPSNLNNRQSFSLAVFEGDLTAICPDLYGQDALAAGMDQEQPGIIQVYWLSTCFAERLKLVVLIAIGPKLPLGAKSAVLTDKELNKVVSGLSLQWLTATDVLHEKAPVLHC